ncbi:hypothetical protein LGM57_34030 [Burkholderia cepacia]|uniref:hypothetical protein n=1 Tax=Burkholderia cepacia TaxID=292 RepID=UPI000B670F45|nr:hypothetical protein [Burkholderia cepacia]MCA7981356.1 hypothetical protein [Burkholderia cepacia]OUE47461.1 hypothetical protein BZY94_05060 [Burkholderia territorii]HDR9497166.1 hypothetical protein [Burkholderia cepacia]
MATILKMQARRSRANRSPLGNRDCRSNADPEVRARAWQKQILASELKDEFDPEQAQQVREVTIGVRKEE